MNAVSFIRIPKNASTSLYSFFGESNLIRNDYLSADNSKYMNIFEPSHCTISEAEALLGDSVLDAPVIAVTRNPYDRLVSMFFFARKHDLGKLYDIDTESFDDFAEHFYRLSNENEDFFHGTSQKEFMKHEKTNDFHVCRFEQLEEDIASFIKENGLNFDISRLEKLNSTEHRAYTNYYTDKSRKIVEQLWADDLEHYSYSFDDNRSNIKWA